MQLQNKLTKDGLFEEIDDICGTDYISFPVERKIARINNAIDEYLRIAFDSAGIFNFDLTTQTDAPIDTQDLVSGTNAYKLSDFSEKIRNIIKLSVLDSNGVEIMMEPESLPDYPDSFVDLYKTSITGTPDRYFRIGDYIYIRVTPDYNKTDGLRAYIDRDATRLAFTRFTVTIASPGVISATGHGLSANDQVVFQTNGALPTGLTAGVVYYVQTTGLTTDAFRVSTTQGGSDVDTSGSQSGEHSFLKVNQSLGILEAHNRFIAKQASADFLVDKSMPQTVNNINLLEVEKKKVIEYFARRDKDLRNKITFEQRAFK